MSTSREKNLKIVANATYNLAAVLVVSGLIVQTVEPFRKGTASGLSLVFVVLFLIAALLRFPFFIATAAVNKTPVWQMFASPMVFLIMLVIMYLILIAVKVRFDLKESRGNEDPDVIE